MDAYASEANPNDHDSNINHANIKVAVRLRPLLQEEADKGFVHIGRHMEMANKRVQITIDRPALHAGSEQLKQSTYKTFKFDHVFGEEESQESLFEQANIQFYVSKVVQVSRTQFLFSSLVSGFPLHDLRLRPDRLRQNLHNGRL